tara:strand:- start:893 stop:1111 length:219 start_codon:yes stop_codon:yes gene_type:complete
VPEKIELTVTGMTCEHCVRAVTEAISGVEGVLEAKVDLDSQLASVIGDGIDLPTVVAAITEEGYEATQTTAS